MWDEGTVSVCVQSTTFSQKSEVIFHHLETLLGCWRFGHSRFGRSGIWANRAEKGFGGPLRPQEPLHALVLQSGGGLGKGKEEARLKGEALAEAKSKGHGIREGLKFEV